MFPAPIGRDLARAKKKRDKFGYIPDDIVEQILADPRASDEEGLLFGTIFLQEVYYDNACDILEEETREIILELIEEYYPSSRRASAQASA